MSLFVTVANVTPQEAAEHYQSAGVSGTAVASVGFGAWGVEPGTVVEFGTVAEHAAALTSTLALLKARNEQAAYVRPADRPAYLLYADGREEVA